MKKCPFCAEQIQDEARICRFCNRDLTGKAHHKLVSALMVGALLFLLFIFIIIFGRGTREAERQWRRVFSNAGKESAEPQTFQASSAPAAPSLSSEVSPTLRPMRPTKEDIARFEESEQSAQRALAARQIKAPIIGDDNEQKNAAKKMFVDPFIDNGFDLDATLKSFSVRMQEHNFTQEESISVTTILQIYSGVVIDLAKWGYISEDAKNAVLASSINLNVSSAQNSGSPTLLTEQTFSRAVTSGLAPAQAPSASLTVSTEQSSSPAVTSGLAPAQAPSTTTNAVLQGATPSPPLEQINDGKNAKAGGGMFQRTKESALFRSVLIWNNYPRPDDKAFWTGGHDANGYAEGQGTLRWYTRGRFVTEYVGRMVRGKLDGPVKNTDASGKRFHGTFIDGVKSADWTSER
jgi:hypothetical protein